jgi:hypothetical protein
MRLQGNPSLPPPPGSQPTISVAAVANPTVSAAPAAPATIKEIFVPGDQVGRIIGRQGGTIRTIQELSGAHADIESSDGSDGRRCIKVRRKCTFLTHACFRSMLIFILAVWHRVLLQSVCRFQAPQSKLPRARRTLTANCGASRCLCPPRLASTRAR